MIFVSAVQYKLNKNTADNISPDPVTDYVFLNKTIYWKMYAKINRYDFTFP